MKLELNIKEIEYLAVAIETAKSEYRESEKKHSSPIYEQRISYLNSIMGKLDSITYERAQ